MNERRDTPWLIRRAPADEARVRLFCFPFAGGGSAAFQELAALLPGTVEPLFVVPPGREQRLAEEPFRRMEPLVDALLGELGPELERPYALLGHSLGALVAYELTRRIAREGFPLPARLFALACRAPHRPDPDPPVAELPDAEFRAELVRLGGTPPEVLAHAELMDLFVPLLRADFALNEGYTLARPEPLDVPLTVVGGRRDPKARPADVEAWRELGRSGVELHWLEADHFFLGPCAREVRDLVVAALRP